MSFFARKGKWGLRFFPKAASTAFSINACVAYNGSGQIIPATSTTDVQVGIIRQAIAATDSDYASTTRVAVEVPLQPTCEMEGDVTAGTLAAASVGSYFDFNNSLGVNQGASANRSVLCTGFITAARGMFQLNSTAANRDAV